MTLCRVQTNDGRAGTTRVFRGVTVGTMCTGAKFDMSDKSCMFVACLPYCNARLPAHRLALHPWNLPFEVTYVLFRQSAVIAIVNPMCCTRRRLHGVQFRFMATWRWASKPQRLPAVPPRRTSSCKSGRRQSAGRRRSFSGSELAKM